MHVPASGRRLGRLLGDFSIEYGHTVLLPQVEAALPSLPCLVVPSALLIRPCTTLPVRSLRVHGNYDTCQRAATGGRRTAIAPLHRVEPAVLSLVRSVRADHALLARLHRS